jgi:hypothetical protein
LYGAFALGWLALAWRDARSGLLFAAGPLLAPLGLLALVPLVVQPARGIARRATQAVLAVFAAALAAGIAGERLPLTGDTPDPLGISPLDSPVEVGVALGGSILAEPRVLAGAVAAGIAASILPWARRRSRYGVLAVGAALLAGVVGTGAGVVSILLVALVWGVVAAVAAGTRR